MNAWHDAENYAEKAQDFFENGRLDEAEEAIRQALQLDPDRPEWLYNLGMTLEARGMAEEALKAFEEAAHNSSGDVEPVFASGLACVRLEAYESALKWFERVIEIEPDHAEAHVELLDVYLSLGRHEDLEIAYYFALEVLQQLTAPLLLIMAESLMIQKSWPRAKWCLEEAIRVDPKLPGLRVRLGTVLLACGDHDGAISIFESELASDPLDIDLRIQISDAMIVASRKQEACDHLIRIIELQPANVVAHERLGHIQFSRRKFNLALESFDLVSKLKPDDLGAKLNLVRVLLALNQVQLAGYHLRPIAEAIKEGKFEIFELTALAEASAALLATGDSRLAELAASKSLSRLEESQKSTIGFQLRRLLALSKFRNGDFESASLISRRIFRDDPECLSSCFNLGLAAFKTKKYRLALAWVRRGFQIDPNNDSLRKLRARIYMHRLHKWTFGIYIKFFVLLKRAIRIR